MFLITLNLKKTKLKIYSQQNWELVSLNLFGKKFLLLNVLSQEVLQNVLDIFITEP